MATPVQVPVSRLPRHSPLVRVTHGITIVCFAALLLTGVEILISHPRFYWGETGNVMTSPLFAFSIPSSRGTVPTGYGYVLPDQNGWSRYLHFQAAWLAVLTGLLYVLASLLNGHFRRNLLPAQSRDLNPRSQYNVPQRLTYLCVLFVLFPLVIETGLAMSPGIVSAFPLAVTIWGGQQSARTIHFAVSVLLLLFVLVHVTMVVRAGFRDRVREMTIGSPSPKESK